MVRCSFRIPLKSFRFENNLYESFKDYYCLTASTDIYVKFINLINNTLDNISMRDDEYVNICGTSDVRFYELEIVYLTSNNDISISDFIEIIESTIFTLLDSLVLDDMKILLDKSLFSKGSICLKYVNSISDIINT